MNNNQILTSEEKIDFVIPWVDGSDPQWLHERRFYRMDEKNDAGRYTDWGTLKYFFRGTEKYAGWVNKIYFVTWGHIPEWMDAKHPKIKIINHKDYIPRQFLPTFNSNVIELNYHRISGLSDKFIVFNDDFFLIDKTSPSDFFLKGMPRSQAILTPFRVRKGEWFYTPLNDVAILNEHFSPWKSIAEHPLKWINLKYGIDVLRTIFMLPYNNFFGLKASHLPTPYLKETFKTVWKEEGELLNLVCNHRFRESTDLSHWLMDWWQCASGLFVPRSNGYGKVFHLTINYEKTLSEALEYIAKQKGKVICINDGEIDLTQREEAIKKTKIAFEKLFPEKSSFEK